MEHGTDLLRTALTPYLVEAAFRRADKTAVVTVSHGETKMIRVLKQVDLQDRQKLADIVNDFKRDMAFEREGAERERVKLFQHLGPRGLSSFNSSLDQPFKLK